MLESLPTAREKKRKAFQRVVEGRSDMAAELTFCLTIRKLRISMTRVESLKSKKSLQRSLKLGAMCWRQYVATYIA